MRDTAKAQIEASGVPNGSQICDSLFGRIAIRYTDRCPRLKCNARPEVPPNDVFTGVTGVASPEKNDLLALFQKEFEDETHPLTCKGPGCGKRLIRSKHIIDFPDLLPIRLHMIQSPDNSAEIDPVPPEIPGSIDISTMAQPAGANAIGRKEQYELYAVIAHTGEAQYGHYKTILKDADNNWIELEDDNVKTFNHTRGENQSGLDYPQAAADGWSEDGWTPYKIFYRHVSTPSGTKRASGQKHKQISGDSKRRKTSK